MSLTETIHYPLAHKLTKYAVLLGDNSNNEAELYRSSLASQTLKP